MPHVHMAKRRSRGGYETRQNPQRLYCREHGVEFPLNETCPACRPVEHEAPGGHSPGSPARGPAPIVGDQEVIDLASPDRMAANMLDLADNIGSELTQGEKWAIDAKRQLWNAAAAIVKEKRTEDRLEKLEKELRRLNDRTSLGGDNTEPPADSSADPDTARALGLRVAK